MKLYLTWSPQQNFHLRTWEKTTRFYQRQAPYGLLVQAPNGTGPLVVVYDTVQGRTMLQADYDKKYAAPPPSTTINWQSAPVISGGSSTPYVLPPGNYLSLDATKPLLSLPRDRLVIIDGCRLRGYGQTGRGLIDALSGAMNLQITNSWIEVLNPQTDDKSMARVINADDVKHAHIVGNTFAHAGRGIYLTGYAPSGAKKFTGDPAAGQYVRLSRNKFENLDSRRWDGVNGEWRRSNFSVIQANFTQFKNLTGAKIGYDIANMIQLNGLSLCPIYIEDNYIAPDLLGQVWEDTISLYGGSGGTSAYPGYVRRNATESGRRYDWNASYGGAYDSSGQIQTGATSPQDTSVTRNSATSILTGDNWNTSSWERNTSYITVSDNIGIGFRPYITCQGGHLITMTNNQAIDSDYHHTGAPVKADSYHEAAFQWSDYSNGATAPDVNGVGRTIWGQHTMNNNTLADLATGTAPQAWSPTGDVLKNGGSVSGNIRKGKATDGGKSLLIQWQLDQAAAGRTIGSTVTPPNDM